MKKDKSFSYNVKVKLKARTAAEAESLLFSMLASAKLDYGRYVTFKFSKVER